MLRSFVASHDSTAKAIAGRGIKCTTKVVCLAVVQRTVTGPIAAMVRADDIMGFTCIGLALA